MTNRQLLTDCLENMTVDAWKEFVRRFEPVIAGSIARVAGQFRNSSVDLILDLTQEVYLKLCGDGFRLLHDLRMPHDNSLFAYLKLVACSVAHDHFKKQGLDIEELRDTASIEVESLRRSEGKTPEERLLLQEIEKIINRLTEGSNADRDRTAFWLHHRMGLTTSEIAAIPALRLGQKAVESMLYRLKLALRDELLQHRKEDRFARRVRADFPVL